MRKNYENRVQPGVHKRKKTGKMVKPLLLQFIILAVFLNGSLFGQEINIRSSVSKNKVGLNEQFEFTVEVSGQSTSLPSPKMPSLDAFNILSEILNDDIFGVIL